MNRNHLHLVTGRLASPRVTAIAASVAAHTGETVTVETLPITVAALMTPAWIAARWNPPAAATQIVLPGYCQGDLTPLQAMTTARVERGPRDVDELPQWLGGEPACEDDDAYEIQILAEINHAPQLSLTALTQQAQTLAGDGADVIDVGCDPGGGWTGVGEAVRALRDLGLRVSIDSFDPLEIAAAVAAGAELVLSVNASNRDAAADWGVEVVAVPDEPADLAGLDRTVELLAAAGVPLRMDPILAPIGCGFAASLGRYLDVRRRYPEFGLLMGVGNLTEMTAVDSAGVNALLLGFCQELGVGSVLTTQVAPWTRSSVRECDAARRLMSYAVRRGAPPKRRGAGLVMLRDESAVALARDDVAALAEALRDPNYRLFAADGELHVAAAGVHRRHVDPFALMEQLLRAGPGGGPPKNLDASHAFYLGYELCLASLALALGKAYRQDEGLDWGVATTSSERARLSSARVRPGHDRIEPEETSAPPRNASP